ncbi:unnamed protein product [Adineta steineri]|uniref:Ig-like domain-containing protein n=1 Tax=Adineta steineri TaxID=433720 RepID=A0A813NQZ2_9BILA|nr:unnamed protein product [Adineta steineri]
MADQEEHHHPHRTTASANFTSASDGSISQVHVNVSDTDAIFNSTDNPPTTTTISTIAVQAGESRIILAILRSSDIVRVRIQQMEPDLLDIGSNLGATIKYQTVHDELISKLKAKQDHITELLTRADDLVTQQKSYNEVYEAMARSLGEAWKELNLQLEGRRNLLNQAIRYHTIANRFNERVNDARSWFTSLENANFDNKLLNVLFDEHDLYRKEVLEASLDTINEGQRLLECIKHLGSLNESINQHSIVAACFEIEHLLGIHHEERQQFEDEWERNRKILSEYIQMSEIKHEIDQILNWLQERGQSYLENTDLGRTLDDNKRLQNIHNEIEHESQNVHDRVLRCMRAADSWVHTGLIRADRLHAHAHTLLALWEKWALKLDSRRRLLRLTSKFYIDSSNALTVLDSLDTQLLSLSTNQLRSSEDLIQEYNQINEKLIQSTDIPLREGHILLEKTSINDSSTQTIRERVYDLEKRIEKIRNKLKEDYDKLDRQGSSLYQTFDHECTRLQSWLYNVAERFLNSNRIFIDLNNNIDITQQANDFLESHQQIIERDLKNREEDIHRLGTLVHELQLSNDRNWQAARTRFDNIFPVWQNLSDKIIRRHTLAQSYVDFRYQAEQLSNGLASIDDVIGYRDNIDLLPESAVKHIEETWSNLRSNFHELINNSKRIRHALETESEHLNLQSSDTHRSIFDQCEHITRKFEQISSSFDLWIRKLANLKDFKSQWQQFVYDARTTIDKVHRFELNIVPTSFSTNDNIEKYQRLLSDFANTVQEITREVEDRLRIAEQLSMRGETNGQKEQIVNELVKVHQQYLSRINQTRSFLHTMIDYYKNTSKIEIQLTNNEQILLSLPNDIRSTEVLMRQYETEREKIIQTYEQCRQDARLAENKAQQCGTTTFINEIHLKQNEIESKYTQWQQQCEENRSKLKQRVEWCQFLDDKYKIVYEISSLQHEIDRRKQSIPQTYRDALSRVETMHEINRLYDSCERAVRRFRTTAEIMIQQKHPEYEQVEYEIRDVEKKLSVVHVSIGDYREHVDKTTTYYKLIDEMEQWHQESSQLLIQIGRDTMHCQTGYDTKILLDKVSKAIDQGKEYEQEKMKYITTLAVDVFGPDEGHHQIKHVTAKNIELINAFIKVHQDISVVQRNFEHRTDYYKETKQLPVFIKPLKDITINEGTKFTFECIIDGVEPINVTWLKDKTFISSLTHDIQYERGLATLSLIDVQKDDSAYYTCRASNTAGTVESSAYLIVKVGIPIIGNDNKYQQYHAPTFVEPLRSQDASIDSTVIFECILYGEPTPHVIWERDGVELCEGDSLSDSTSKHQLYRLTLRHVQLSDAGEYACRARNITGEATSVADLCIYSNQQQHDIIMSMEYEPRLTEPLKASYIIREGQPVKLSCRFDANPRGDVQWLKDGIPIDFDELGISRDFTVVKEYDYTALLIKEAFPEDEGSYAVVIRNFLGEARSFTQLTVEEFFCRTPESEMSDTPCKPIFVQPLLDTTINEGQKLKLHAAINAHPEPEIIWYCNNIPLKNTRDVTLAFDGQLCTLIKDRCEKENDHGLYRITAVNSMGQVESICQVNIQSKDTQIFRDRLQTVRSAPNIIETFENRTVHEGERILFQVRITGQPKPQIIWYKDNQPLRNTHDHKIRNQDDIYTLEIPELFMDDAGTYMVKAINIDGEAKCESILTILPAMNTMSMNTEQINIQSNSFQPAFPQVFTDRKSSMNIEQMNIQSNSFPPEFPQVFTDRKSSTNIEQINIQSNSFQPEFPQVFTDRKPSMNIEQMNIQSNSFQPAFPQVFTDRKSSMNIEQMNIQSNGFPPEFLQLFTDRQSSINSTIKFEARLIGTQPLNVYWLFNGIPILNLPNNQRYQQQILNDTYSLTVHDVQYEDIGRYTLNAENSWGKATCTAELFIPPTSMSGTESNSNMLSDLLVKMSPSPPSNRKRHIETTQQHQQQTSSTNTHEYEQEFENRRHSSFSSSNTNKRYRPLQSSLERAHSITRDDECRRRQYPKSIDVFIPFDLLEKERTQQHQQQQQQQSTKSTTMTRSYECEVEQKRRSSSMSNKQQRKTDFNEQEEYLRCLRDLTEEYEKNKRQKKSVDNRKKKTTIDTQEEYESIEEVYHQRIPATTTTTTTTEEIIQRSAYQIPKLPLTTSTTMNRTSSSSMNRINQFERQFVDNFAIRPLQQQQQQQQTTISYSGRNENEQRLTAAQRSFSEELLYKRLIPTAKQLYTTPSATASEAGFVTSEEDLTTMEYRLKRKERLKPIRIFSSTSSIPGETSIKYVRTERQPVELLVPKPQIVTTQGEHSTTVVKDVRRSTGKITTNVHQQHQRATIEGEHELRIIEEPISSGQTLPVEFTIPKPVEILPSEHSSTFVVESKKGGRFQTLDISSALTREHTLTGEHELRVISEPISSGLHNKAVELLFPKPPLPPAPSQHSSTVVKHTRAAPSSLIVDNIQTTLKGEHELRYVDKPIQSGPADSVELIVPKSVTETAEHTTTIVTETQPQRRVLEITGSGRKMESEHETKFFRDSVRVEEEVEVRLPKQQIERAEHTTTIVKHSRGKGPIIEVDSTHRRIEGEHETRIVEESVEAIANSMQLLVAKPQLPAEHSTTIVKEQRGKSQIYSIDRTQSIPGEHETKYYEQPVEAFGEMQVVFPKHQPVIGPLEGEHMSTLIKQVHGRQIVYDDRLREIPGEHSLTVIDNTRVDRGAESEVEFIVPKTQMRRTEEYSRTNIQNRSQRPVSSSDYDEVFASSAGEEETIRRRRYRYDEEEESGWTSGGEHTTTYVKHARAKFEPVELVVDKPRIMPSISTLIADIQGPAQITSIRPSTVVIPEDSSVKLNMDLNSQNIQEQYDEMELVFEKPLVRDSSTKLLATIQPGLEIKSFRPTTNIQQQSKTIEENSSSLTMQMQHEQEEETLELRIRKPHIQESSSVLIANIQPELGIQGGLKASPYIPQPIEESSTALTMELNADQEIAPFELIIPRFGVESSTSTVVAQIAPTMAGIRAKVDIPHVEKSTSKFVLEQKKRFDEEVELIMPKPRRIETSTTTMLADVEAKLETKQIRPSQYQSETSTSTFYLDQTIPDVIPEPVEIRLRQPIIGESSTTLLANVKATLDTQQIKVLGNQYQPMQESSSALFIDTVSNQIQPSEVELILPRPHIQESTSVVFADVRPTLDTSQTHIVFPQPIQYPVKSSSQLILQQDEIEIAPVELHLHRQPSSHTLVAKLDDTRTRTKDMYVLGTGNTQEQQQYGYQTRDSSSTLYTDYNNRPVDTRYNSDNRRVSSMSEQQRREFHSKMTTSTSGGGVGVSDNSSTFITEIEPRQLEPVEFIVSGSLTGNNNRLEQYSSGGTNHLTTTTTTTTTTNKRTMAATENTNYDTTKNIGSNENYAPYFISSLHDQTVREGESVLFEIVVSALPLAEIIWDKDGEIIGMDSAFRIDYYSDGRATLYIQETFIDDQGYYTCTAVNSLGSCRTTARLICKSTNERMSPTRRQLNTSAVSSSVQFQRQTSGPSQQAASYRVYSHSEPSLTSRQESPSKIVTEITEETQVIQIPPQKPQYQQHNEISYTVQGKQPKLEPVSFQVSTIKENIQPNIINDGNNDPNPFKIFGAKLRSRPTQGIVPSYDDPTTMNYSQEQQQQQTSSSNFSQYHPSSSQQPHSSSFSSTQPNFTKGRQ